ncbi:hypothetical protein [Streptomyces sp. MS2.AVA.5]|uniref:Uncharacterized protein n=1 Tax=Streptomyces achmelvichensis TaxID=3134111 RepID=A0ACC6Q323_9ACTN
MMSRRRARPPRGGGGAAESEVDAAGARAQPQRQASLPAAAHLGSLCVTQQDLVELYELMCSGEFNPPINRITTGWDPSRTVLETRQAQESE